MKFEPNTGIKLTKYFIYHVTNEISNSNQNKNEKVANTFKPTVAQLSFLTLTFCELIALYLCHHSKSLYKTIKPAPPTLLGGFSCCQF